MKRRLRVLFAGSGAFGLPTLEQLAASHEVVHVYTQPDRPAGRGKKLTATPVGEFADDRGLPVTRTERFNDEALPEADALVVIAFGQKISDAQANHARLGAMNLHASLLPRHRGAAPIHHSLLAGDDPVGNSVIRLADRMDAGAVLLRGETSPLPLETTGELHDRLAVLGAPLVLRTLGDLAAGRAVELPQDESKATRAGKLSREDGHLDFRRSAAELARQVNGLSPWPGCRVSVSDRELTLLRAEAIEGTGTPGRLTRDGHVGTRQGLLRIVDVQPQGGKPMSLADYRNGRPWPAEARVHAC